MKIALIGSAGSVYLAPYEDATMAKFRQGLPAWPPPVWEADNWDIWACSPGAAGALRRCTRFFELHRWEPGQPWFTQGYCEFLRSFNGPVYVGGPVPLEAIPNQVAFPIEAVETEFSAYFLTSSLSLMFGLAILEIEAQRRADPKHDWNEDVVGFWGVDMAACTSYETRVLTEDLRWVQAKDVQVGDRLIAFDEHAQSLGDAPPQRRWRVSTVEQTDRLTKPCYRLYMEDGTEIVCSEQHKWLTYAENECRWKLTKDLVTNMHRDGRPTKIVRACNTWTEDKSWEAGYLAAAFDGEGHISQTERSNTNGTTGLRIGFAQRDNEMLAQVKEIAASMGFELGLDAVNGANDDCHKYSLRGGRAKTLEFLGRIRPRRLLAKFNPEAGALFQKAGKVAVLRAEYIGEQPVIGLKTTTGTIIAEGLASHNSEEYEWQRPGCQFFILEALRRGIGVYVPPESCLLRPQPIYGISEWQHNYIKLTQRSREINARLATAQRQKAEAEATVYTCMGALEDLTYNIKTWGAPQSQGLPPGQVVRLKREALKPHLNVPLGDLVPAAPHGTEQQP